MSEIEIGSRVRFVTERGAGSYNWGVGSVVELVGDRARVTFDPNPIYETDIEWVSISCLRPE